MELFSAHRRSTWRRWLRLTRRSGALVAILLLPMALLGSSCSGAKKYARSTEAADKATAAPVEKPEVRVGSAPIEGELSSAPPRLVLAEPGEDKEARSRSHELDFHADYPPSGGLAHPTTGDKTELEFEDGRVEAGLDKPKRETEKAKVIKADVRARPASAGVKAGSADDNLQFNAFLGFLEKNGRLGLGCDVSGRMVVSVRDRRGLPIADVNVQVMDGGRTLLERRTYADGRTLIFPSESEALRSQSAKLAVSYAGKSQEAFLNASGGHQLDLRLDLARSGFKEVPLDIALVMDTTGSMGDEIERLKQTIETINFQISNLAPRPDVRFGMVLYRDRGDDYRTQLVPFTGDIQKFSAQLGQVQAGGGGDNPEDVQEGLQQAMTGLKWRENGVKLAFLIGDAPPHLDYQQSYTYVEAMRDAARRGVKIATIGASGLDLQGEVVWRQIAQYTLAPFVFLTYGEKGDSEGSPSSVSHHLGSNWVAENLDAIVVRMVKVELAHYSPTGAQPLEDYFVASDRPGVEPDSVLQDLFQQSVKQLVDYSVQRIQQLTPTVVLPVGIVQKGLTDAAKKLEGRLALSLVRAGEFQLVEGKDLPELLKAVAAQSSLKYDSKKVAELGKLVPAKLAVFSQVDQGQPGNVEMLIKLVRLETGEILSLSLLKIEEGLILARR